MGIMIHTKHLTKQLTSQIPLKRKPKKKKKEKEEEDNTTGYVWFYVILKPLV